MSPWSASKLDASKPQNAIQRRVLVWPLEGMMGELCLCSGVAQPPSQARRTSGNFTPIFAEILTGSSLRFCGAVAAGETPDSLRRIKHFGATRYLKPKQS